MTSPHAALAALVRRVEALSHTDDPAVYQQAQITTQRLVRAFAKLVARAEAARFTTKCLVCNAPMVARRSTKRTCSAKCRQVWSRLRRDHQQPSRKGLKAS